MNVDYKNQNCLLWKVSLICQSVNMLGKISAENVDCVFAPLNVTGLVDPNLKHINLD